MLQIPIQATPSQIVNVVLGGQYCQINLYQKDGRLYLDLNANGVEIVSGTICENAWRLIRFPYRGFLGNLIFFDLQGNEDPIYTGLNTRWTLNYLETTDDGAEF